MRNIKLILILCLGTLSYSYGQSDIIISQYIEDASGGSFYKGIEIFNVSGADITFSVTNNLQVYQGTNGAGCVSLSGTNITSGTLSADEVWVIGTSDLITYANTNGTGISGVTTYNFAFNGNDALQVYLGGTLQDEFGTCGIDPGSAWSGSGVATNNNNLQIAGSICDGDTDGWSDPSTRFTQIANGNTPTGFGNAPVSCSVITTNVEFVNTTSMLAEDGVFIDICVEIANEDVTNATTVEIDIDGASTATNGTDYDDGAGTPASIIFPQTLTFPAGSSTNQCLTIFISNDDAIFEPSETVVLNLQNASGGDSASLGTNTQHTLTITDNDNAGTIMITQYYEGSNTNKWVEIKNVSGAVIPANSFYIVILNNGDADDPANADPTNGSSPSFNNNVLISTDMAIDEVRRYREPSADLPAYASPGELGYDGNPTFDLSTSAFSGDDIVLISSTNDNTTWANRIDVIGDGTTWGNRTCFIRNECIANGPSITFDINNWIVFTDAEVETPTLNTNPYLGQHFQGATTFDNTSSWDNGNPDRSRILVLDEDYDTAISGNIEGCSLIINATSMLTVRSNTYAEVQGDITNDGELLIEDEGSVVQVLDTGIFDDSGSAVINPTTVEKFTAFIAAWYDYTYWSSPVANETIGTALFQSSPIRRYEFIAANFEDSFYEDMNDNTQTAGAGIDDIDDAAPFDWQALGASAPMVPGVGYAATHSTTAFTMGPNYYKYTFYGTLNNGPVNVPVERNDTETGDTNWNLIGNPYASAIDADLFFTENNYATNATDGRLEGAIYLWSQSTDPSNLTNGNEVENFDTADYAMINGSGEVAGGDTNNDMIIDALDRPSRYIPSGQGFFVTYSDNPGLAALPSGFVRFNNSMRVKDNNDTFFKSSSNNANVTSQLNKLWLNLSTDNGFANQLLISYVPGATAANDGSFYDAKRNGAITSNVSFYSLINGDSKKLGIQGKAPSDLNIDEIVPLGFSNSNSQATLYTISINDIQGDFLTNHTVYLKDNLMSIYHDLSTSNYTFTSNEGEFNNRFEIVFKVNTLSVDDIETISSNLSIIELDNNQVQFRISQNDLSINNVKIYNVQGRLVYDLKGSKSIETYNLSNLSQAPFIALIKLSNGQIISKKTIKTKI